MSSTLVGELARRDYWDINNLTAVPPDAPYPYSSLQMFGFFLIFTLTGIAFCLCCVRVYGRALVGSFGWDDILMITAQLVLFVEDVGQYKFMRATYVGVHYYDIPQHNPLAGGLWNYVSDVAFFPILSLVKVSALLFLLRFCGQKLYVRHACFHLILFEVLKCVAIFFVSVFQCWPIENAWNTAGSAGHCIRQDVFSLTASCLNLLTCAATGIVPFFIFLDLKINRRLGIALVSICGLGLITIIVGAVRIYYIYVCYYSYDIDRQYSLGYSLSAVECALAIIVWNLPALWPVYRRWLPNTIEQLGLNPCHEPDIEIFAATTDENSQPKGMRPFHRLRSIETLRGARTTSRAVSCAESEGRVRTAELTYKTRWARQRPGPRAVYAHRSIGGTSFVLDDNTVPSYWRDLIMKSRGPSEDDDEDSIEMYHGFMKQMGPSDMKDDEGGSILTKPEGDSIEPSRTENCDTASTMGLDAREAG